MRRTSCRTVRCSSWLPCEKLSRNTFTPALMRARIFSGDREAGPRVDTILVLREAIAASVGGDFLVQSWEMTCSKLMYKYLSNVRGGGEITQRHLCDNTEGYTTLQGAEFNESSSFSLKRCAITTS